MDENGIKTNYTAFQRLRLRPALILVLITAGAYAGTLANDFVAGDRQFIMRNRQIAEPSIVLQGFTSDYWGKLGGESFIYYRPLTIFTHFIDVRLYGLNPVGHHLTNLLFHSIVTLLVFQLFLSVLAPHRTTALLGAALFALHPIHTHSVSYVVGRTDILASLFFLCGLILLIPATGRHQKWKRTLGACCCYLLALLCKEIAVTLPLIFLLHCRCQPDEGHRRKWSSEAAPCLSLGITLAIYLALRFNAVGIAPPEGASPTWYSISQRVSLVIITLGFYLKKLFLPINLCYYSNLVVPESWQNALQLPLFWLALLWVVSFATALMRDPHIAFCLGWMGITLLPVLNIVMIPTLAKENFLYLPSVGFCLLLSQISVRVLETTAARINHRAYANLLLTTALLLGGIYLGATVNRNIDYRSPLTYLESALEKMEPVPSRYRGDPRFFEGVKNFYLTNNNLGILYQEEGRWEKAADAFEKALTFTPSYFIPAYSAAVMVSLAGVYEKMGRLDEADTLLKEARPATSRPSHLDNLLGVIAIRKGNEERAGFYFKRAIGEDSSYAPAHYNLGVLFLKKNALENAREHFMEAARLNPVFKRIVDSTLLPPPGDE